MGRRGKGRREKEGMGNLFGRIFAPSRKEPAEESRFAALLLPGGAAGGRERRKDGWKEEGVIDDVGCQ